MRYLSKVFLICAIVASLFMIGGSFAQADGTSFATINGEDITGSGANIAVPSSGGDVELSVYAFFPEIADQIVISGLMSSSGVKFFVNGVENKGPLTLVKDGPGSLENGTEASLDVVAQIIPGSFGGYLSFPIEVEYYTNNTLQTRLPGLLNLGEQETRISLYPESKSVTLGKAGDFLLREWVWSNSSDDAIGAVNLKVGYAPNNRTVKIKAPTTDQYKDVTVRVDLYINDNSAIGDRDVYYTAAVSNSTRSTDLVRVTPNPVDVSLTRGSALGSTFSGTTYLTLRIYKDAPIRKHPITFTAIYDSGRGEASKSETITIDVFQEGGTWQPIDLHAAGGPSLSILNAGAYNIQNLSLLKLTANHVNPFTGKFALLSGLGESSASDPGVFFQPDGYSPDTVYFEASYDGAVARGSVSYTCPYCVQFDGKQNDVVQKGQATTFKVVRQDGGNVYTTQNWNWAPVAYRNGVNVTGTEITFSNVYSNGNNAFFTATPTNAAQVGGQYKLHLYTRTLPNAPTYDVPQFAHPNAPRTVIAEAIADLGVSAPAEDPYSLSGSVSNVDTEVVRLESNVRTHTLILEKQNIASTNATILEIRKQNPAKGGDATTVSPEARVSRVSTTATQDEYAVYVDTQQLTELGGFIVDIGVSATSTSGQSISQTYSGSFSVIEEDVPNPQFVLTLIPSLPDGKSVERPTSGTKDVSYTAIVSKSDPSFNFVPSSIAVTNLPTGVTKKSVTHSLNGSTLDIFEVTLSVAPHAQLGEHLITVTANAGAESRSRQAKLTITAPPAPGTFTVTSSPASETVIRPTTGTVPVSYEVTVAKTPSFAFTKDNITVVTEHANIGSPVITHTTNNVNSDIFTVTLNVRPNTQLGEKDITFYASTGSETKWTTSSLNVSSPGTFTVTSSPASETVIRPTTGTVPVSYEVTVAKTPSFAFTKDNITVVTEHANIGSPVITHTTNNVNSDIFTVTLNVRPNTQLGEKDITFTATTDDGSSESTTSSLRVSLEDDPEPGESVELTLSPDNRNVTVPKSGSVSTTYNVNIVRPADIDGFTVSDLSVDSLPTGVTGSFALNTRARVGENEQQFTLTVSVASNAPGSEDGLEDTFSVAVNDIGGNVIDSDSSMITLTKDTVVVPSRSITLSMPAQKNIKRGSTTATVSFPITAVRTGSVGALSPEHFSLSPEPLTTGVTHSFTNVSWSNCDGGTAPEGASCHSITFSVPTSVENNSYPFTVTASREGVSGNASSVLSVSDISPPDPDPIGASLSVTPSTGNAPLTSTLTLTVTNHGAVPYTYEIDANGDGRWDSSSASYEYTYGQGSYTAIGRVTDALGARATATVPVTVNAPIEPLACTLSASKTEGIVPFWTQFTLNATGGSGTKSYSINPGDGRPSYAVAQHTHDYRTSGTYTAVGTVSDDFGNISCNVTIRAYNLGGGETNPGGN